MPDPIEQGFVMSLIPFPPNKKTVVLLVQPSDKEIEQKTIGAKSRLYGWLFSAESELVKSKICLLCNVARCIILVLNYVSIICISVSFFLSACIRSRRTTLG